MTAPSNAATPPLKSKKAWYRKKRVVIPSAIVGLLFVVGALNPATTATTTTSPTPTAVTSAPATAAPAPADTKAAAKDASAPRVGSEVRDGKFTFTVQSVTSAGTTLGDGFLARTAQGEYWLVTMKVLNSSDKPQMFSGSNQKLYVGKSQYGADISAAMALPGTDKSFLNTINPGNSVVGVVVFDLPAGAKPTKVSVHDSVWSGGASIAL